MARNDDVPTGKLPALHLTVPSVQDACQPSQALRETLRTPTLCRSQARANDQTLDLATGETKALKPMTATGSGQSRDPHMVLLEEVLAKVNALFDGEDFTPGQQRSWVEGLVTVLGENDTVRSRAVANTSNSSWSHPTCPTPSPAPSWTPETPTRG